MRSLVTGATGFLGGALVRQLCDAGETPRALVRPTSDTAALRQLGVELVEGDVTDLPSLQRALEGVDAVYHLAADFRYGCDDPDRMEQINVAGTRYVIGAAQRAEISRIVYCSSVVALGAGRGEVFDETRKHPGDFRSHYERTKYLAHEEALRLAEEGAPVVVAMPGLIYGPGDNNLAAQSLRALTLGKLPATFFPDTTLSPVHVDDVATGLRLCMENGAPGRSYILCGEPVTQKALMEMTAEMAGQKAPRFLPTWMARSANLLFPTVAPLVKQPKSLLRELIAMLDGTSWAYSSARAREELGFETRPLRDGWAPYVAWLRDSAA